MVLISFNTLILLCFLLVRPEKWCPKTDLNRRPITYEAIALPTELLGRLAIISDTITKEQEPPTSNKERYYLI